MPDQVVYPALALIAAALIALALAWPQGQGARSPAPFGHPPPTLETVVKDDRGSGTLLRGAQSAPTKGEPDRAQRP